MKTHLDLFSGIGGFALAAGWAGYDTIGFCEIDPWCQRVLRKHWADVHVWGDVRTLTAGDVSDATCHLRRASGDERSQPSDRAGVGLITAGYPCQPFSLAGKRLGAEDDRHLWPEVKRLLAELRPAKFLGENVAGHVTMGLDAVLSDLEEIGYAARSVVIPACAVGAPHRRDRVWILGYADDAGLQGHGRHDERAGERLAGPAGAERCADVADAAGQRERITEQRANAIAGGGKAWAVPVKRGGADQQHEAQQRVGVPDDGLPRRLVDPRWGGDPMNAFGPDWEDGVPRVVAQEEDRVNRLKALGNAIVPQVAYQVLLAMEDAA